MKKVVVGGVVLAAVYFLVWGGEYTFLDLWRLDQAREQEERDLEAVRAEVGELQQRADSLATDSAALERLAREQYGLIKEGERLYRFVEPDSGGADAAGPGSGGVDGERPGTGKGGEDDPSS